MPMEDLAFRVGRLEEIDAIKELRGHRFPSAGDPETDVEAALELFAEDAEIDYVGIGKARGHAQLRAFFKVDPVNSRFHIFVPGYIRVAEDLKSGVGRWYLIETAKAPSGKTGRNEPIWCEGVYDDEYVKVNGVWKFKRFTCELRMFCSHRDGWGQAAVDFEDFFADLRKYSDRKPA